MNRPKITQKRDECRNIHLKICFSTICVGDYFSVMFQHLTEHVTRDLALNSFVDDVL